jgi:hypothetical protein
MGSRIESHLAGLGGESLEVISTLCHGPDGILGIAINCDQKRKVISGF